MTRELNPLAYEAPASGTPAHTAWMGYIDAILDRLGERPGLREQYSEDDLINTSIDPGKITDPVLRANVAAAQVVRATFGKLRDHTALSLESEPFQELVRD